MIINEQAPPRTRSRTLRPAWSLWKVLEAWHLLSLDAATVAVLWALLLGRIAGVRLAGMDLGILGIGTWLIYTADRLLDGLPGRDPARLRERHVFHRRWRLPLLGAGAAAGAALLVLIVERMRVPLRRADTRLFSLALVYFGCVHSRYTYARWKVKEIAVALLFAAACSAPAWTTPGAAQQRLIPAGLLFAALCWLNCAAIEQWESDARTARWPGGLENKAAVLGMAALGTLALPGAAPAGACVAGSAGGLLLLSRTRLGPRQLRILADVALLTPLLAISFLRA